MMPEQYRCVAQNVPGFIAQIVRYVASGHRFVVRVKIPESKDPQQIDEKLLVRYGVSRKRWQRKRRHLKDNAGIHYLRCRRLAVLMVTKGKHETFHADHAGNVLDLTRQSLKLYGYAISFNKNTNKVSVRLDDETKRKLKAHFETIAVWDSYRDVSKIEKEFLQLPYQPYGPVYKQLIAIAKSVNRLRRRRGFEPVDLACIRTKKRLTKVFADSAPAAEAA